MPLLWCFVLFMCFGLSPAAAAQMNSLRCGSGLIALGDDQYEVETLCGPPTFVDESRAAKVVRAYQKRQGRRTQDDRTDEDRVNVPDDQEQETRRQDRRAKGRDSRFLGEEVYEILIEEWTYNFGTSRFIQTLVFEDGILMSITSGGYGYNSEPNPNAIIEKGDSKAIVFMKYGKPVRVQKRPGSVSSVSSRNVGDVTYTAEIHRPADEEEWLYDFGPDRFLKRLLFRNNRLIDIRTLTSRGKAA